jgi:hypothetical protein
MKSILTALLMAVALVPSAQNFSPLTFPDIEGLQVTRADSFSGKALWGYMDGGADLYLEYGCQTLYVREYTAGQEKLKLEAYFMRDAGSAFGIYKLSISRCMALNTLADFSCQGRYQTAAAYGPVFISVTYPSGSPASIQLAGQIVQSVIQNNPQDKMNVPRVFLLPEFNKYLMNLRFFEGPLGLQNGLPEWLPYFEGISFRAFTLKVLPPDTAVIIGRIIFNTNADLMQFMSATGMNIMDKSTNPVQASNGLYHSWYQIDDYKILFLETPVNVGLYDYLPELAEIQKSILDFEAGDYKY